MVARSAYVHFYWKISKGIFHGIIEEISVENVILYHHQWIILQTRARSNFAWRNFGNLMGDAWKSWWQTFFSRHQSPKGAKCRNPSFGFATKAKGLQGCEPKGSPGVKARRSLRVKARGSPRVKAKGSPIIKARGSPGVKAKGSPWVKAKGSPRIKARGSLGVTSHIPGSVRKCEGVWGGEPSHS